MGKSIPITIGDLFFPSKKAATEAVRQRIANYKFNDFLGESDKHFFLELFKHHSEYSEKVGSGIRGIEVRRDEQGNKYLHLHRTDGTDEDISWGHCISPKKEKTVIYEALRSAVKEQIQQYKEKAVAQRLLCPFYGTPLDMKNSHVDHYNPTFEILIHNFQCEIGRVFIVRDIAEQEGNDYRGIIKDRELLESWRDFHAGKANLRLISKKANLSDAKK